MARRKYPHGRTGPDDEGHLAAVLSLDRPHGRIRLDFGKSLAWVSMTAAQARAFARELTRLADALGPPCVTETEEVPDA